MTISTHYNYYHQLTYLINFISYNISKVIGITSRIINTFDNLFTFN